jgi:hypothetical protein
LNVWEWDTDFHGAFSALATWLHCAQRTKADIEQDERRAMENGSPPGLGL